MYIRYLLPAFLLAMPLAAQGIHWTPSFEAAMAQAKAENKVVLFAFNLAGERANDELVADHYRDPVLGKLSQHTVNVFCSISNEARVPGVTPAQQQAAETRARLEVLKIGPGEDVIAPQHVFVGPDGAVLSSVAWRLTKGELEWAWVDAIRKVDPKFAWEFRESARAPAKLGFGAVERGQNQAPPTKAQVDAALKEVRKSRGAILRNLDSLGVLIRSDDKEAMEFVETTLRGAPGGAKGAALATIGATSPKAYHAVLASYLGDREDDLRLAAATGLEKLAEPKALPALLKQYKLEKVETVRGRLLRAMASSAPANAEVLAAVEKVLQKEPSPELRAQAVLALALLEAKAKVQAGLAAVLRDGSAKVRSTAAYAIASRRDVELLAKLDEAVNREEDPDTKAWLEAAAKVVRGGDNGAFKNFLAKVLGEEPAKQGLERLLDGLDGGGGRGGGGRGGGGRGGGRD